MIAWTKLARLALRTGRTGLPLVSQTRFTKAITTRLGSL